LNVRHAAALLLVLIIDASAHAFGLQDVVDRARNLAAQPYVRQPDAPPFMREMGYDQYRGILYQLRHNLWRDADSQFR
jgi:glucans biosynthesis protein